MFFRGWTLEGLRAKYLGLSADPCIGCAKPFGRWIIITCSNSASGTFIVAKRQVDELLFAPSNPFRYEKMKRRLLRVEMERRQSEDMRLLRERGGKTADEVRAAASRARLARAGYGRPSSIMHIGGGASEVTVICIE